MGWPEPVPDDVFHSIWWDMEAAELGGEFDGIFKRQQADAPELPTKESLLESINPDMKLYKSTFKRIYGYELSYPGFAEEALAKLESAGCCKAREYYSSFVTEYENEHEKEMVKVAEWYRKELERSEEPRTRQQETEQRKTALHQKSDRELLILLQKLKAENAL